MTKLTLRASSSTLEGVLKMTIDYFMGSAITFKETHVKGEWIVKNKDRILPYVVIKNGNRFRLLEVYE